MLEGGHNFTTYLNTILLFKFYSSFCGEELDGTMTICAKDRIFHYKKLVELQFDSYRKCMSVIVRPKHTSDEDVIYVFVKGAETSVLPNCSRELLILCHNLPK